MTQDDLPQFAAALQAMLAVLSHGKTDASPATAAVWFQVLQPYTLAQVTAGMTAHMRHPSTGRTLPIPADIVAQIEGAAADDGRPGPEEAWAIAATARNEAETVVWTEEIAEAYGAAQPVMADRVAARMAFVEVYARLVAKARAKGQPVRWVTCLGHDPARRAEAIRLALKLGRRPADGVTEEVLALPAPDVAGLLTGPAPGDTPAKREALQRMAELRQALAESQERASTLDDSDRRNTDALKREAAEKARKAGLQ